MKTSAAPEAGAVQRSVLEILDEWAMSLPAQPLRDGLLVLCSVFVIAQLVPASVPTDSAGGRAAGVVQKSATIDRRGGSGDWRFIPARHRPTTDPAQPALIRASMTPATQTATAITRPVSIPLEPTKFDGFEDLPDDYWAVQVAAFDALAPLKSMVQRHQLAGAIGATLVQNGTEIHVLLLGIYPTKPQALAASQNLPAGLEQINPWVRSIRSIRQRLK